MYNLKFTFIFLLAVFAGFFACAPAHALEINSLRFGEHGTATRMVMELSNEADFRASVQDNPPRIVVDMPAIAGRPAIGRRALPSIISDIRLEPLAGGHSRLSFILTGPAVIRSAFLMPAEGRMPVRLVIDAGPVAPAAFSQYIGRPYGNLVIRDIPAAPAANLPFAGVGGAKLQPISRPKIPEIDAPTVQAPHVAPVAAPDMPQDPPLIMIDPGHGGIDPGASGSGVHEKDVTLGVAKDLRDALIRSGKYRAKLTRDRDIFIPLAERVRIARREGADLFVSIHADSMPGASSAQGASFYTLSDQASDAQTAKLAARENQADLLAGIQLPTEDKEVATILIDLAMRETTNQSKRFAGSLISAFKSGAVPMLPAPNRHAGFMVLKAPDIPSVLIEVGFLSNTTEVRKLDNPAYRETLAEAIAAGVDGWLRGRRTP